MEGLIILAVIWFVISTIGKGAKKAEQSAKEEKIKRRAQSTGPVPPVLSAARPAAQAAKREPRTTLSPAMRSGESALDGQGCVGGSLPHSQHEGTAQPGSLVYRMAEGGHRRSIAPADQPALSLERARVTPEQMRAAVVMAEVLNRPVSMRGPRTGGRLIR